jgi:hypothetical protein
MAGTTPPETTPLQTSGAPLTPGDLTELTAAHARALARYDLVNSFRQIDMIANAAMAKALAQMLSDPGCAEGAQMAVDAAEKAREDAWARLEKHCAG